MDIKRVLNLVGFRWAVDHFGEGDCLVCLDVATSVWTRGKLVSIKDNGFNPDISWILRV